jgi:predicted dehydrogenase
MELKIGLIGCGGMMGAHVKNGYAPLWEAGYRDFEIIACCDVVEQSAANMSTDIAEWQGTQPRVYTSYEDMLDAEPDMAALDIVVTHSSHHSVAIHCIESGRHVMLEKPLAMTMRAGRLILDAVEAHGKVFSIAENYRRSVEHRAFNWLIESGRIGNLRQLYWVGCRDRQWHWGWRDELDKAGGGWTLDGGIHSADLFRYHIGPVKSLTALSRQYDNIRYKDREKLSDPVEATIEDTTMALLEFENGVTGVWVESIVCPGQGLGVQHLYGDEGSLDLRKGVQLRGQDEPTSMDELKDEFMNQLSQEQSEAFFPRGIRNPLAHEVHEFVEACLRGGGIETDGSEGFKAQAICMAVYESAALGMQPVAMTDIESLEIEKYQRPLNEGMGI